MPVNHEERAGRLWPILVEVAASRTTITYGNLAARVNLHQRALNYPLGHLQQYCLGEKLPPLTILVVNRTGRHGGGFVAWDVDNLDEGFRQVYAYPWASRPNPFGYAAEGDEASNLARRLLEMPDDAETVYQQVAVRGVAQLIFREALLAAYDGKCAFCGLSFPEVLEASHVIPWSECGPARRVDPRNGILLCAVHHRLFDSGYLSVLPDYTIRSYDPDCTGGEYSEADVASSAALHGSAMSVPQQSNLRPGVEFLRQHNAKHGF